MNFFPNFRVYVFSTTLGSPGSKKAMLLRKNFYWHMSFCDPQMEGIPKSAVKNEFPPCCKSLFSEKTRLNYFIHISNRSFLPLKKYHLEN